MPDYVFYSKNRNHFIKALDDSEALEKARSIAERNNVQSYLVMNEKSDVICADYGDESLPSINSSEETTKEVIDRATYEKLREMDHEALSRFIQMYGDDLVERERRSIDLLGMKNELSNIKGIGNKRLEAIMCVVKKYIKHE